MDLTNEQINRYSRQIVLKEVGGIGQKKLLDSKISLIGLGALGSPTAYYLAAAGIGTLQIIDFDTVEISNLHRQILHFTKDIDSRKTKSAANKLNSLNPDCTIEIFNEKITPKNSKDLLRGSDFVIEGSDNLPTKMLINDTCISLKIPFTIAGVLRFHGQIMTVVPEDKTSCYRCVFGDVTEVDSNMSCSQAGVIGFVPGILGCLEANEALKHILGVGDLLTNKIMYVDLLRNSFDFIEVHRDNNCMACGDHAKDLVESSNYEGLDGCNE
ncbi:MAG: HesA/MoeB/ThiF family protein [Candidatus Lokiarchaeota archaeon]|nr:HesA/MoeB/ThiF family protein [Candidatus Lokiarchaeota archaeon]